MYQTNMGMGGQGANQTGMQNMSQSSFQNATSGGQSAQQISQQLQSIQQQLRQMQSQGGASSQNYTDAANYVKDACDLLSGI